MYPLLIRHRRKKKNLVAPLPATRRHPDVAWFSTLDGKKQANRVTPLERNGVNTPLELEAVVEVEEKLDQKC